MGEQIHKLTKTTTYVQFSRLSLVNKSMFLNILSKQITSFLKFLHLSLTNIAHNCFSWKTQHEGAFYFLIHERIFFFSE